MKVKKAKWLVILMVVAMLVTLIPVMAFADGHENGLPDGCQILYAGQNIPVGTVCVENDEDEILVTYKLDEGKIAEGWVFTELHLHIAEDFAGLPKNRTGNPVPGHFEHKAKFDMADGKTEHTFYMDLADIGEGGVAAGAEIFIAAHAVVEKPEVTATDSGYIVSDTNTLVFVGEAWVPSVLTWVHPSWPAIPDAYWIWESEYALNPRTGDVLQFMREFSIPGTPTSGSLVITTDNEFTATLNAEVVGGDNNWATVETYNVLSVLTPGPNTLIIDAVNWPWNTDSSTVNPGGVIYKLSYDYEYVVEEHQKESAWADGTRFVNRGNWATYFCYTVTEACEELQLLLNPGAENGMNNWVYTADVVRSIQDRSQSTGMVYSRSGDYFFDFTGANVASLGIGYAAFMKQVVDVSGYDGCPFTAGGWIQTELWPTPTKTAVADNDYGKLIVTFYDDEDNELGSSDTGIIGNPVEGSPSTDGKQYAEFYMTGTVPAGAAYAVYKLEGYLIQGSFINVFYDDLYFWVGK